MDAFALRVLPAVWTAGAQPVCTDGLLVCALWPAVVCAETWGLSPGHGAQADPDWVGDLALCLLDNLNNAGDNFYLNVIAPCALQAGLDWGALMQCARGPAAQTSVAGRAAEARARGQTHTSNATIWVAGRPVPPPWTGGALRALVCAAYQAADKPAACEQATDRERTVSFYRSAAVSVEIYCGGSFGNLAGACLSALQQAQEVHALLPAGEVDVVFRPAGQLLAHPDNASLVVPHCPGGGWPVCELFALWTCATTPPFQASPICLASCFFWALQENGTNFYSGALAPLDMCAHLCGDFNWGDAVSCALAVHSGGAVTPHSGVAYTGLVAAFNASTQHGVSPTSTAVFVAGAALPWPARSLLAAVCAQLPTPAPPACKVSL